MVAAAAGPGARAPPAMPPLPSETDRSQAPGRRKIRRGWVVAILGALGVALLGLGLRLHGLGRHPIWLDEAYSVWLAGQEAPDLIAAVAGHSGPPLYYLLLRAWMLLFGDGPAAVRALSIGFGLALIPATALLARRIGGAAAGWGAALLAAATPMLVQFSQEARMYTLLPLLAVGAADRLLAYLQEGSRGALAAHALLLAAACWTHNWGVLFLPAAGLAVLVRCPRRLRGWLVAATAAAALYAPWAPALAAQAGETSYRFVEVVQDAPAWSLPLRSAVLFSSGIGASGGRAGSLLPPPGGALVALAWAALLLAGAARNRDARAMLALAATPLLLAAALTAAARPIYLLGRYEIGVLGILLAVAAAAAADLTRGRGLPILLAAWACLLTLGSLATTSAVQRRFPEPALAEALAPHLRAGDRVVFTGLLRVATEYHLRRAGAAFEGASFPAEAARHPAWYHDRDYDPGDPALGREARLHCPGEGRRTWVLATATAASNLLLRELAACADLRRPFLDRGPPAADIGLAVPRRDGHPDSSGRLDPKPPPAAEPEEPLRPDEAG
jgi:hypothetical protein